MTIIDALKSKITRLRLGADTPRVEPAVDDGLQATAAEQARLDDSARNYRGQPSTHEGDSPDAG